MRSSRRYLRPAVRLLYAGGVLFVLFGMLIMAAGTPAQAATGSNGKPNPALQAIGRLLGNPDEPAIWFDKDHTALCQFDAGPVTATGGYHLPEGVSARLQLTFYIVHPGPTPTEYIDEGLVSGDGTFSLTRDWPGIPVPYQPDTVIEVHFGANLLHPDTGSPIVSQGVGFDYYWYPWVCTPTAEVTDEIPDTDTPTPTVTEEQPGQEDTYTPTVTVTEEQPGQEDTFTPTATITVTQEQPQDTETARPTKTRRPSRTPTVTEEQPGQEDTFTPTPTTTVTSDVTDTATATVTVTQEQPGQEDTFTPTPTTTVTSDVTDTATATVTSTSTATATDEQPGQEDTFTPTVTNTVSPSQTNTPTATDEQPGQEDTFTPSPTNSSTPTVTVTPSQTVVPTQTLTPTQTSTNTPTATDEQPGQEDTFTPTPTGTFTPTPSFTLPPLPTLTFTPSPTNTFTLVPTQTFTASVTPTSTVTSLPSLTLESVCGYVNEEQQVWQITNPNPFAVEFLWQATATGETGTTTVPANSIIYLTTLGPPQNLRIYVNGILILEQSPDPDCLVYLELGVACTDNNQLAWMVFNENPFAVNVFWNLNGTSSGSGSLGANSAALVTVSPITARTLNLSFEFSPHGPRTVSLTTDITSCEFTATPSTTPTITATLGTLTPTPTFTVTLGTPTVTATFTQTVPPQTGQEPTFTLTPTLTGTFTPTATALVPQTGQEPTFTATLLPTLPAPVITSTPILIPVTGTDLTPAGSLALLGRVLFNLGMLFLGSALLITAALFRRR